MLIRILNDLKNNVLCNPIVIILILLFILLKLLRNVFRVSNFMTLTNLTPEMHKHRCPVEHETVKEQKRYIYIISLVLLICFLPLYLSSYNSTYKWILYNIILVVAVLLILRIVTSSSLIAAARIN